jgi:hypothetical protein
MIVNKRRRRRRRAARDAKGAVRGGGGGGETGAAVELPEGERSCELGGRRDRRDRRLPSRDRL